MIFSQKPDFPGDFQGPNLTMRENLGAKSFQQALISNGLEIICKVSEEIYTPVGYRGGGGGGYGPGAFMTEQTGHISDRLSRSGGFASSFFHCARGLGNNLQAPFDFAQGRLCGAADGACAPEDLWFPRSQNRDLGHPAQRYTQLTTAQLTVVYDRTHPRAR